MLRNLLLLAGLLFLRSAFACSCFFAYRTLDEQLCLIDSLGGKAMEVRVIATGDEGAFLRVERTVVGVNNATELFVNDGNDANCGWAISQSPVGSKFLLISGDPNPDQTEYFSFECGAGRNLYLLNPEKTRIQYLIPSDQDPNRPAGRDWINYSLGLNSDCVSITNTPANPLDGIFLTPNPGFGQFNLNSPIDSLPAGLQSVEIFDLNGRLLFQPAFDPTTPQPLNLSGLPAGVYIILLRQGNFTKSLRYVKM